MHNNRTLCLSNLVGGELAFAVPQHRDTMRNECCRRVTNVAANHLPKKCGENFKRSPEPEPV